jgi:primosomal protein N' (replication factor Y)
LFNYAQLTKRYSDYQLPEIQIIDLKQCHQQHKMYSFFSEPLLQSMQETLQAKQQVILFKNLRGFASTLRCEVCGWVAKCPNCDVSLTVHKHSGNLNCHYCGCDIPLITECPQCHSHSLRMLGNGSEKIEEETQYYFPNAKVARMDLDTTRSKDAYQKIIDEFESGNIDILCGTQLVSKGFDFCNVGLVGIIDADNMLHNPDFRAYERCYSLLTQVAGRSGRSEKKGKVIIQTFNPYHQVFKDIAQNNYKGMYNNQIVER